MLRCGNELAAFLLSRRGRYAREVMRVRVPQQGIAVLDDVAADQLVGGLLASAVDLLATGQEETLWFCLEIEADGLRSRGEELSGFVGSMAAFFVGVTDDVARAFPAEHREEVIPWLSGFCAAWIGGSVRVWERCTSAVECS